MADPQLLRMSVLTEASLDQNTSTHAPLAGYGITTNSTNEDEYKDFYLRAQFITGLVFYPIICLFGLTGNVLSIIVLNHRKMASSTNTFLKALAISDGIKLVNDSFYFLVILLLHVDPPSGEMAYGYLYPYAHYFFNMSICTTAWLTVSVAAERYILVCHATKARDLCSIHRARFTSIVVFIVMSIMTIPFGLRYRTTCKYSEEKNRTALTVAVTELWSNQAFVTTYTWIQNLLRSIVPLFILCTLNYFIVQALRRTRAARKKMSSRHRVTLMLVSVIVVFMVCVTPDAIMSAFFQYGYYEASFLVRGVREITDLLLTVNSGVNFVLYCTFNKVFRRSFISLFCRRCCGERIIQEDLIRRSSLATARQTTAANGTNGGSKKDSSTPRHGAEAGQPNCTTAVEYDYQGRTQSLLDNESSSQDDEYDLQTVL